MHKSVTSYDCREVRSVTESVFYAYASRDSSSNCLVHSSLSRHDPQIKLYLVRQTTAQCTYIMHTCIEAALGSHLIIKSQYDNIQLGDLRVRLHADPWLTQWKYFCSKQISIRWSKHINTEVALGSHLKKKKGFDIVLMAWFVYTLNYLPPVTNTIWKLVWCTHSHWFSLPHFEQIHPCPA